MYGYPYSYGYGGRRRSARLPAFNPASCFMNGEKGFAHDYTDLTKLFQVSDGSTPVTAPSDPIGYARDLSGNGNHATQATNARRPILATGGARALFSSSRLTTPAINLTAGDKFTAVMCFRNTGSAAAIIMESSANLNTIGNVGAMQIAVGATGAIAFGARGSGNIGSRTTGNITRPYERVVMMEIDIGHTDLSDEIKVWIDGAPVTLTNSFGPLGGGNLGNFAINFGARANDTIPASMELVRSFGVNRLLSEQEKADVQSWVGAPIGFFSPIPMIEGVFGIEHLISYGQSLSVGVGTGDVRLTNQPHDSLMFSGGVRAQDGGAEPWTQHSALVPLVEAHGPAATGGDRYETPLSGATLMLKELESTRRFLASAPGQGSVTIATLSKGGVLYERLLDDVRYGRYRAHALGQSHKVRAFFWMQGEADGANNSYAANLDGLRVNISADVKAITSQPEDVWCISYQLDRPKIGLAHLAASDAYSRIRVAMPIYHLARTDGVHLTPAASDIAGAYFAIAWQRIIGDGDTDWQPLRITGHSVAGAVIDLVYDPVGSLAFDTATVAAQTNQGFRLFDSGGSPLTINSVAIVDATIVRITAAATVPAGAIVRYGFSDPADHTANISKGNLRDSQGDAIVFEGQGLNYPMHNWAVLEQVNL